MEKQLTFGDLDTLIDTWTAELQDYQNVFTNQLSHIKQTFWIVGSNDEKMYTISFQMGILNYMYLQLENELEKANYYEQILEQKITELERLIKPVEERYPLDYKRTKIYDVTENINCYLIYCKDEMKSLNKETKMHEHKSQMDPVEQVAKIMMKLLEKLEVIETNMEQIKNRLQYINYMRDEVSRRFHIKM